MNYEYKEDSKFPHIIYIEGKSLRFVYEVMNPWCKENFGEYRNGWFCPNKSKKHRLERYGGGFPYSFKYIEDAVAFKIRFSDVEKR